MYELKNDLPINAVPTQNSTNLDNLNETLKMEMLYGISSEGVKFEEEAILMFLDMSKNNNEILTNYRGTKIDCGYSGVLKLMEKKHSSKGIHVTNGEDSIIFNYLDGVEAFKSQKNIGSIISFSSSLFTPSMIQSKTINGGSIFNICTWM